MQTIVVEPKVYEDLQREAKSQARDVNELVNEAMEHYLEERRHERIQDEIRAYISLHPTLKEKYLGEWVAIYEQQLVDHDPETINLYRRVRAKYGNAPVLIRQVEPEPDPIIWVRTPSTGKISS
ncbi:MAG: hypothetical protein HY741_23420 [Chloroflexi bacterium]|nr:hypothetical protein [Chloroflexota bacterium]